ncbi:NUDIX domain-containing protein [Bacillus sp. Xin]|uniref:NUDIX hydrolase n=1 Tax=unclassified Bacillus (in: firmicutes) TaxID=185979 RepID=UPI001574E185|nr:MULTISPECIES: NUDIX domain-containing protein [unclassified Bacillus (in: firmicutes)]MBC6973206.1 NUDIX domain-containing protein [Bacillus sp. Xin]NSW36397.1 NUDIX domain-containing protein [Bacillus sp. Xin1]
MGLKPSFGYKKENQHYILRPSCYAITFDESCSKVAVIKKGTRYFLPGGGMENAETREACLHRELLEELGWLIEIKQYIGNAEQYFYAEKEDIYYLNDGYFYLCKQIDEQTNRMEQDHKLQWLSPSEAQHLLTHQQWAVKQATALQK